MNTSPVWPSPLKLIEAEYPSLVQTMACPPGRCQAIIWTSAEIESIRLLETNFSEIEIHTFSFRQCISKCHLENDGYFISASVCLIIAVMEIRWCCITLSITWTLLNLHYNCVGAYSINMWSWKHSIATGRNFKRRQHGQNRWHSERATFTSSKACYFYNYQRTRYWVRT